MMIAIGIILVFGTIYFLIKRYDARLVLLASGIIMACVAGTPMASLNAFAKSMTNSGLIQAVCSVMGFAMVMKYTECDKHLINFMASGLAKVRPILIPGVVVATYAVNIALPSAAGTAAAAGAIFVPLMMSAGIHPAMAAAAVKCGTYGSMLNPGLAHNPFVAKIAGVGVMDVIGFHYKANIASLIVAAVMITALAYYKKEHQGYKAEGLEVDKSFKVNYLFALMPILPIIILILGTTKVVPALKMDVPQAMIIGALLSLLATRKNPVKLSNAFFDGMEKPMARFWALLSPPACLFPGLPLWDWSKHLLLQCSTIQPLLKSARQLARLFWGWSPVPATPRHLLSTKQSRPMPKSSVCRRCKWAAWRRWAEHWVAPCRRLPARPSSSPGSPASIRWKSPNATGCRWWGP